MPGTYPVELVFKVATDRNIHRGFAEVAFTPPAHKHTLKRVPVLNPGLETDPVSNS
jgi:hypothetical protein